MRDFESIINNFIYEVAKTTGDEPLDGDGTQEIANKVHESLDEHFGNTSQDISAKKYASTSWCVEDVLNEAESRGVEISNEDAETLLSENSDKIVEAMVRGGWDVIAQLLNEGKYGSKKEAFTQ